jgi:hypothetical protein
MELSFRLFFFLREGKEEEKGEKETQMKDKKENVKVEKEQKIENRRKKTEARLEKRQTIWKPNLSRM